MSVNIPYTYSVIHNNMATTKGLKWAIDFTEGKKVTHRRSEEMSSPPGYTHKMPTTEVSENSSKSRDEHVIHRSPQRMMIPPLLPRYVIISIRTLQTHNGKLINKPYI
jgi:preprotein translocase subunit SecF